MPYELFISLRHLRARHRQKFISLITWISIGGVAVGVMALIVVIAVMSGFGKDLRDKINTSSKLVVFAISITRFEALKAERILNSMTFDIKNLTEIMKLETQ